VNHLLVIEFSAGTTLLRESDRPSQLPIVGNGPPGTFVLFPDGLRVSLPTDQIVAADDDGGHVRAEFGGMRFLGLERDVEQMSDARLVFVRFREVQPSDRLSPDRSHTMYLEQRWVSAVDSAGVRSWPAQNVSRSRPIP
jgi:hypothetical protein